MGWFSEIYVKDNKTGNLVNITSLDKEHYENFLEVIEKIKIAYHIAVDRKERNNGITTS